MSARGAERPLRQGLRPSRCRRSDRKSTRLNSSHITISYAVYRLKKNTTATRRPQALAAVSRFILAHNPEIVITHCMVEPSVVDHTVPDRVYRSWQDARRKGARLG